MDGVAYHFLSPETFAAWREQGKFLECFAVHHLGFWYGTPRSEVDAGLAAGKLVILEIDVHGAEQIRRTFPDCVSIFIRPADMRELEKRLRGRGTESEERIQSRLATAREEMAQAKHYDYEIVNVTIEDAVAGICAILKDIPVVNRSK